MTFIIFDHVTCLEYFKCADYNQITLDSSYGSNLGYTVFGNDSSFFAVFMISCKTSGDHYILKSIATTHQGDDAYLANFFFGSILMEN